MTTHTPGPWHVSSKVNNYVYARDGLDIVAQCDTMGEEKRSVENANARLIAAAPDLLECLIALLDEQNGPPLLTREEHWKTAVDNARVAIAKATSND